MANKKGIRRLRKVEIEVPIPSVKQYVGGSGPPMQKLYLVPPRDSTAYIIDRYILPPLKDTTPLTRRIPYYYIGWTDKPLAKTLIPCNRALEYVSPAEIEQWEADDYERRLEEKAQGITSEPKKIPGKVGRPRKKPVETSPAPVVTTTEDALVLARRVTGPSLSTPQKRRFREPDEEDPGESSNMDSDEAAIQRQIHQEGRGTLSGGAGTGYADDTDHDADSVDQIPSMLSFRPTPRVEDSSRTSSATPVPSGAPVQPPVRALSRASSPTRGSRGLKPLPAVKPPTIPSGATAQGPSSAATQLRIHPSFLQNPWSQASRNSQNVVGASSHRAGDGLQRIGENGFQVKTVTKPKPRPQPANIQKAVQQPILPTGFTPIAASRPRVRSRPSTPAGPAQAGTGGSGMLSDASAKRKRESSHKKPTVGQPKEKKAKTNGKGKGKKRAESEEEDPNAIEDDVWVVKELLGDRYVNEKGSKVHQYLVNWEGDWPADQNPTWEPAANIRDDNLIAEYRRRKKAGLLKPDKSQKTLMSFFTTPQYSNVAEAFEGDVHEQEKRPATGIESDSDESDEEKLLVTDPAHGGNRTSPKFPLFDQKIARYQKSFNTS